MPLPRSGHLGQLRGYGIKRVNGIQSIAYGGSLLCLVHDRDIGEVDLGPAACLQDEIREFLLDQLIA